MVVQAQSLLVTCKPSGRLVRVIQGAGAFRDQAIPSLLHIIAASDVEAFKRFMRTLQTRGHAFDCELRIRAEHAAGTLHLAGLVSDGVLWVAAAQDRAVLFGLLVEAEREMHCSESQARCRTSAVLDELTYVNNELVNLQRELAQRNAALVALTLERNQLLGIAAHDLRNPLMVVQSYCELLMSSKGGALDAKKAQFVERVHEATDAMLLLLKDTLDYSRLASADLKLDLAATDLTLLVEKNVCDYQPLAERKQITLALHRPAHALPMVRMDVAKIERVLVNLLSNAIKYSPVGSEVDVYVTRHEAFARVSVSDHGEGIDEADLPLLFRAFQTGKSRPTAGEPSTGLGLAIVKKLVEAHEGQVVVSSRRHGGSSFSFELPFEPSATSAAASQTLPAAGEGHANDPTQHS